MSSHEKQTCLSHTYMSSVHTLSSDSLWSSSLTLSSFSQTLLALRSGPEFSQIEHLGIQLIIWHSAVTNHIWRRVARTCKVRSWSRQASTISPSSLSSSPSPLPSPSPLSQPSPPSPSPSAPATPTPPSAAPPPPTHRRTSARRVKHAQHSRRWHNASCTGYSIGLRYTSACACVHASSARIHSTCACFSICPRSPGIPCLRASSRRGGASASNPPRGGKSGNFPWRSHCKSEARRHQGAILVSPPNNIQGARLVSPPNNIHVTPPPFASSSSSCKLTSPFQPPFLLVVSCRHDAPGHSPSHLVPS